MKKNLVLVLVMALLASLVLGSVTVSAEPRALADYEAITAVNEAINGVAPNPCYLTYALETEEPLSGTKSLAFMLNPDNSDNGDIYMNAPGGNPTSYAGYSFLGVRMKNTDAEYAIGFQLFFHGGPQNVVSLTSWDYDVILRTTDNMNIEADFLDEYTLVIPEGFDGTIYFSIDENVEAHELRAKLIDLDGGWEGKLLWDDAALYNAADIPEAAGSVEPTEKPEDPKALTGTPTIDGVLDAIYTVDGVASTVVGPAFFPMNCEATDSDATATSYILHDATNLYIATVVTDDTLVPFVTREGDGSWINDAVEIYISASLSDLPKVSVGSDGTVFVGGEGVTAAAAAIKGGYVVEMSIPLKEGAENGAIGLQLNDLLEDDGTTQKIVAHGVQTANFKFDLSADVAEIPVEPSEEPTEAPTTAPTVEPSAEAPETSTEAPAENEEPESNIGLIIGIVAGVIVIAVVVILVVKGKKKAE